MKQISILFSSDILGTGLAHSTNASGIRQPESAGVAAPPPPHSGTAKKVKRAHGSVTDIPEEREIGEDVTTLIGGITQPTPAEDPVEQHDLSPGAGIHTTPPMNEHTSIYHTGTTLPYHHHSYSTTEEVEPEDRLPGTGNCPEFEDITKEHHVIIRHENCEIFISHDDSIRWFGQPGFSPPSVYVRNFV
ncbi:uncharacterized protein LOC132556556 [Ylistrum balloti]|uniref:uncharacterized protein LOC132556556 n=1 Tax=Ylistrum balloti TaxID=509963 RepID=UPI002905B88F|nr:uncharacterized protein LOC132556556 [Ylistrum balloti]